MPPDAILIAGVNGAGKTSFAREVLPGLYPTARFLNADEIQRGEPGFDHPVTAGRELLRRLDAALEARESFVLETTLSSARYARRIPGWREIGYRVELHFIEVSSVEVAIERVALRVAHGGHDIPTEDIRRRFTRSHRLFHGTYKRAVSEWYHWRSDAEGFTLVEQHREP